MGRNQQHRTGRTRGRRIFIRVSDQEFEEIRAAADMKGVSVSRYLVEAHETCTDLETAKKKYETGPIVESWSPSGRRSGTSDTTSTRSRATRTAT